MKRLVVPIDMGGSPTKCLLNPPQGNLPTPELVESMVEHYTSERLRPGHVGVEVAFFRGGIPSSELLSACRDHPIRVACSPADLSRSEAARLVSSGVRTIELEVASLDPYTLRRCQRGYRVELVRLMLQGLSEMGVRLGATLISGLPGSDLHTVISDTKQLAAVGGVDFVRLYPAVAFEGSGLARWFLQKKWEPLADDEAVSILFQQVEILTQAGIEIARIGLQVGQDVPLRPIAGTIHPNLRQEVEVLRFRQRLMSTLEGLPFGSCVILAINPKDITWVKGTSNENIRFLRSHLALQDLTVTTDPEIVRGEVKLVRVI